MNAPTRGLYPRTLAEHGPMRTVEQAEADRLEARQGGWPMRDRKIGALQCCMALAESLRCALETAGREMETGNDCGDELAQLADIVSNLRIRIKELA